MKRFALIAIAVIVGFSIGRFTVCTPTLDGQRALTPDVSSQPEKSSISDAETSSLDQNAQTPPKTRMNRNHEAGEEFIIEKLVIRIGQPIIKKTKEGEICFALPFEFENKSEGRI